jgi:hypothetical protein
VQQMVVRELGILASSVDANCQVLQLPQGPHYCIPVTKSPEQMNYVTILHMNLSSFVVAQNNDADSELKCGMASIISACCIYFFLIFRTIAILCAVTDIQQVNNGKINFIQHIASTTTCCFGAIPLVNYLNFIKNVRLRAAIFFFFFVPN